MAHPTKNTSLPPLTVVVPVYNGENFLRETLESVLAQSYPAVAIIVVNDGSTDRTLFVASEFGDRIRVLDRENAGVSASRNAGISTASTDWVALMDHDDLWEKEHLANLARAIARNPEADVCYSGGRELIPDPVTGVFHPGELMPFPSEAELPRMLMERCAFIPSATAVRRSAVLAAGGFDSRYVNLQDWELWLRLFHRGAKFIHTPEPTLLYRVHPASRTHKALQTLKHSVGVVEEHVLPHLSAWERATRGRSIISRLEGEAAILLRQNGSPGALSLMLRSIVRHPFMSLGDTRSPHICCCGATRRTRRRYSLRAVSTRASLCYQTATTPFCFAALQMKSDSCSASSPPTVALSIPEPRLKGCFLSLGWKSMRSLQYLEPTFLVRLSSSSLLPFESMTN